jgi:SagB-type dehydrogenase family enzyme
MLEDIQAFYEKTKLNKPSRIPTGRAPIEHVYIFHKSYPRLPSIKLPKRPLNGEYEMLLKRRKSYRVFSNEPVSLAELSNVLKSLSIVHKDPERRTYPSAGARYPVEIYLVSFNIAKIKMGVYHFNFVDFSLESLLNANLRDIEKELISPFLKHPAGVIVLTGVMSRSYIKYGNKGYPYTLIEAGHIAQNLLLSCTKYNLGICPVGGFVNDTISRILDLTNEEVPLYVLGFGHKK